MTRRNHVAVREGRFGSERDRQIRTEIAQAAAKLIIEHGLDDWARAKRKAARQLGVNEQSNLPSREELEQAIREYNNLYRPQSQALLLRARRKEALVWMKLLAEFSPRLTSGVATGLATDHSEIRIEVVSEDSKPVEFFLLSRNICFEAMAPGRGGPAESVQYLIDADGAPLRLVVIPLSQRRNLGRERLEEQLDTPALEALLQD
jgi:hypothetical protein